MTIQWSQEKDKCMASKKQNEHKKTYYEKFMVHKLGVKTVWFGFEEKLDSLGFLARP